jgi:hypothetical protein
MSMPATSIAAQASNSMRSRGNRHILRRSWTRPFDFPRDTAVVRFLSPPLYARPAILARAGFFLREPAIQAGSPLEARPSFAPAGCFFVSLVPPTSFDN